MAQRHSVQGVDSGDLIDPSGNLTPHPWSGWAAIRPSDSHVTAWSSGAGNFVTYEGVALSPVSTIPTFGATPESGFRWDTNDHLWAAEDLGAGVYTLWEWDGVTWTNHAAVNHPNCRGILPDLANDRILFHFGPGGTSVGGYLSYYDLNLNTVTDLWRPRTPTFIPEDTVPGYGATPVHQITQAHVERAALLTNGDIVVSVNQAYGRLTGPGDPNVAIAEPCGLYRISSAGVYIDFYRYHTGGAGNSNDTVYEPDALDAIEGLNNAWVLWQDPDGGDWHLHRVDASFAPSSTDLTPAAPTYANFTGGPVIGVTHAGQNIIC